MEVPPSPTVIPRKREAHEISPSLEGAIAASLEEAASAQVREAFSLAQGVLELTAEQTGSKINLGKQGPKLETILNATYQMARHLVGAMQDMTRNHELDNMYQENVSKALDEQLSSYQSKLQKPLNMFNDVRGNTVWDAIYHLHVDQTSQPDAADFGILEAKVTALAESFDELHEGIKRWSQRYNETLENLNERQEMGIGTQEQARLKEELTAEWMDLMRAAQGVDLGEKEEEIFSRISELEKFLLASKEAYKLDTRTLYGAGDVKAALDSSTIAKMNFGCITDPYLIYYKVDILLTPGKSAEDLVTGMGRAASQGLSMDEAFVIASHNSTIPAVFSDKVVPGITEIQNLKTYDDYRCRGKRSGLADRIEEVLPLATKEIRAIIEGELHGFDLTPWRHLANTLLESSVSFIRALFQWADETYAILHGGGNSKKDSWWIISYVIRSLFTRYFAPVRVCSHRTHFADHQEKASEFIWSAIKCHAATTSLLRTGIKDHAIVVGAFAEWLVHNSGRKEAVEAKESVEELKEEIKALEEALKAQKKTLTEVQAEAVTAKKTADKAFSKVNAGKGGN
jgi:hypothetical protein